MDLKLDLNLELIKNPSIYIYASVSGVSMIDKGINDGDLLVTDKSVELYGGCLAIACIDSEFTLKRSQDNCNHGLPIPVNKNYKPIQVTADNDFMIWSVVRYVIKKV